MNGGKDVRCVQVDGTVYGGELRCKKKRKSNNKSNSKQRKIAARSKLRRVVSITLLAVIMAALVTIHSVESTTTSLVTTPSNQLLRPAATTSLVLPTDSLLIHKPVAQRLGSESTEDSTRPDRQQQRHTQSLSMSPVYDGDANNNHVSAIGHINQQKSYSTVDSDGPQTESANQSTSSINLEAVQEFEPSTSSGGLDGKRTGGQEQSDSVQEPQQQSKQQNALPATEEGDGTNHVGSVASGGGPLEIFTDDNYETSSGEKTEPKPIIERRFGLFKKSHHSPNYNNNNNNMPTYPGQTMLAYPSEECERCFLNAGQAVQPGNLNWMLDAQYRQPIASPSFMTPGLLPMSGYMSPLKSKFQSKFQFMKPGLSSGGGGGDLFYGPGHNTASRYRMPVSGRYRMPTQPVNCLQPTMIRNNDAMFPGSQNQEPIESNVKSYPPVNQQY